MARPEKLNLEYFPLDVSFDDSIELFEAECGLEGFAILIKVWQKIYSNSYFCDWNPDVALLFSRKINSDLSLVNSVIDVCLRRNIFDKTLHDKFGILTSAGIQKRYLTACSISKRKKIPFIKDYILVNSEFTKLITELTPVNSELTPINSELSTQSKVKESKVNKRKEKERKKDDDKKHHHLKKEKTDDDFSFKIFKKLKSIFPNDANLIKVFSESSKTDSDSALLILEKMEKEILSGKTIRNPSAYFKASFDNRQDSAPDTKSFETEWNKVLNICKASETGRKQLISELSNTSKNAYFKIAKHLREMRADFTVWYSDTGPVNVKNEFIKSLKEAV